MCVCRGKRQREGKGQKSGRQEISHTWGFTERGCLKHSRLLSRHTSVSVCVTHQLKTQTEIFFKIQDMSGPKAQTTGIFHFQSFIWTLFQKLIKSWIQIEETIVPLAVILSFSQKPRSILQSIFISGLLPPPLLSLFFFLPPILLLQHGGALLGLHSLPSVN